MNKHTSFEFSKLLANNGCSLVEDFGVIKLKSERIFYLTSNNYDRLDRHSGYEFYSAFDIFWDICVKYRNEFFGSYKNQENMIKRIWDYLIMGHNDRAEAEIWAVCLFNPKNKVIEK
jgi:hypothetical protein